jgi:hypothetical protein
MKEYTVLYAEDVPHYGFATINAKDAAEAIENAKILSYDISEIVTEADWINTRNRRICHIESPDGETVAMDIDLDQNNIGLFAAMDAILDASSDLQAAIDGVTDQFDEEVERLAQASRALDRRLKEMRGEEKSDVVPDWLDVLEHAIETEEGNWDGLDYEPSWLQQARAIIAKVRGQS